MSSDRETTRLVRSWLADGVTALPDRVLDSVLDQLHMTPQRRPLWPPRRFVQMNRIGQMAIAAAVVVVVATLGYNLLPSVGPISSATPSPTPSPTAPPSPTPTPTAPPFPPELSVPPGTYSVTAGGTPPFAVSVPAGWWNSRVGVVSKGIVGPDPGIGVGFGTWPITAVYADACHWKGTAVPVEDAAAAADALLAQAGHTSSVRNDVVLGGLVGPQLTLSLDASFDATGCDQGELRLWPEPGTDENERGGVAIWPGQTTTVWVMQTPGTAHVRLGQTAWTKVFFAFSYSDVDSPPTDVAELNAVVDSVEFSCLSCPFRAGSPN